MPDTYKVQFYRNNPDDILEEVPVPIDVAENMARAGLVSRNNNESIPSQRRPFMSRVVSIHGNVIMAFMIKPDGKIESISQSN